MLAADHFEEGSVLAEISPSSLVERPAAGQRFSLPALDATPPPFRLLLLAIQHVLSLYAGAVTVPLVVGAALHLTTGQTAYLVSSDLLACGLVTLVQCLGLGGIGVRLPVMMGVTFVAVGPALAIAANPELGLPGVFGAGIAAGIIGFVIAPLFGRLAWLFAPVVTGTAMLLIGVTLMGVAVTWATGAAPGAPGELGAMGLAVLVLATILVVTRFGRGFLANAAILIGVVTGFAVAWALGGVDLAPVAKAGWFAPVAPLHFGWPRFDLLACASMTIVMIITMVESSGMLFALGRIVEKPLTPRDLARALRADAVGAIVGGVFNSLPYTSYSQNVALVAMTGVRSRFVCAAAGAILILLAAVPKLAVLVTAIPHPVLGGAALVMFGMVAASGVRTLGRVDFGPGTRNLYVVALGVGVGLIPNVNARFFDNLPPVAAGVLRNGVMLGIVTAVVLNLLLNRRSAADFAEN
jgi:NCS2 family nucleobase:cation symporter-2